MDIIEKVNETLLEVNEFIFETMPLLKLNYFKLKP